jgi:hypothetical protein
MGHSGAINPSYGTDAAGRNCTATVLCSTAFYGSCVPAAAWADLPDRFPSGCTCFRRFTRWVKSGVMRQLLESLARHLEETGRIDLSECFIDGTFVVAKKGDPKWERPSGARVRSSWLLLTLMIFHSSCTRLLLSPHEALVEATLDKTVTVGRPRRLIGDRAYDSDPLDQKLAQCGIKLIAPHRKNRVKPASQDGPHCVATNDDERSSNRSPSSTSSNA